MHPGSAGQARTISYFDHSFALYYTTVTCFRDAMLPCDLTSYLIPHLPYFTTPHHLYDHHLM